MIGIGITTYNRNEVLRHTLEQIKKYSPEGCKIVVVDDGSKKAVTEATYRFDKNVGTPKAKNKCFELLEDCEHIFLFDDDCYPIKKGWEKIYISAGVKHLNYTFKYSYTTKDNIKMHDNPNGCMMYFHNDVLKKVGGFDPGFLFYGYWHGNMSLRICNSGLIDYPFMDVVGSEEYFNSMDENKEISTSRPDKNRFLRRNKDRYEKEKHSTKYYAYKDVPKIWYSNPYSTEKNIGKALNEFCELVPDEDWICLQDGDIMYLTPDWGKQIEYVVSNYGHKYSLFGCMTNRLGRNIQRLNGEFSENHDVQYHYNIAKELSENYFGEVEDITRRKYIAGMFMLFPKKIWNQIKFKENTPAFDDYFSTDIVRKGKKIALIKGLYVYHAYRIWSDTPIGDRKHLK